MAKIDLSILGINKRAKILINHKDTGISRTLYIYGIKEPLNTLVIYLAIQKYRPSILDVGSNIGYFPLIEAFAGAPEIYAIEPVSMTYDYLRYNMQNQISKLADNNDFSYILDRVAVSDMSGLIDIYIPKQFNQSSVSLERFQHLKKPIISKQTVKCKTLYEIINSWSPKRIVMLRMDVEGHERKVLQKIPDEVKIISMELHSDYPYSKEDAIELLKKLQNYGFMIKKAIYEINPYYLTITKLWGLEQAKQTYLRREKIDQTFIELIISNPVINTIYNMFTERKRFVHLLLER